MVSEIIVPRWEWRSFGEAASRPASPLRRLSPERVQESDEVYLLSVSGTDAVKVRDGLMDVKTSCTSTTTGSSSGCR